MTPFPDWSGFTPEVAASALTNRLAEAEKSVAALEASALAGATYENTVWALSDAVHPLWETWGMVGHELSVMNSPAWRKVEEEFQPKLVAFSLRVGQSRRLYDAAKEALAKERDPLRRRVLEKTVEGARLAGVGLEGAEKERFNAIESALSKLSSDFANAVIDATAAYKLEKDGKTYTIDDANYPETMKHCADRSVREALCRARAARAPENAPRISEILALRAEKAKLLGFATAAEVSLSVKSAPSVAAVMKMIDDLDAATDAPEKRERAELKTAAGRKLEPWDIAFEAERLREKRYAYSEAELKRCFDSETVLAGLFRMTSFLFGVEVVEATGAEKPSVWHPDVRFFAVRENGRTIAHFYFDPFVRNGLKRGGAWMNEFSNRSDRHGRLPLAVVVTNFPEKGEDGRSLLPLREVETIFHEFGHALQCMLTTVADEEAAGINLVEWDAVEIASQFMENWCLDDRTGISVPAELKAKVKAAKNFRAATACRRQLAFAKIDLLLHSAPTAPTAEEIVRLKRDTFDHFAMPILPEDRFLCAFSHIFAGGYAAGYYGYKWAEVMSADCFGAFEEAGLKDDAAVRRTGAAYRGTVLSLGGSLPALEVFRRFRGRDPEIAALLRQNGLCGDGSAR